MMAKKDYVVVVVGGLFVAGMFFYGVIDYLHKRIDKTCLAAGLKAEQCR